MLLPLHQNMLLGDAPVVEDGDPTMGSNQDGYGLQLIREDETVDGFGVASG